MYCRVRALNKEEQEVQNLQLQSPGFDSNSVIEFPTADSIQVGKKRFEFNTVFPPNTDQSKQLYFIKHLFKFLFSKRFSLSL